MPAGYEAELARDGAKVTRREENKVERDSRAEYLHRVFPDTNTNHIPIGDWKTAPAIA